MGVTGWLGAARARRWALGLSLVAVLAVPSSLPAVTARAAGSASRVVVSKEVDARIDRGRLGGFVSGSAPLSRADAGDRDGAPQPSVTRQGTPTVVGDLTGEWPRAARRAFDFAAGVIASHVQIRVPIVVAADWRRFVGDEADYVGFGRATKLYYNFPDAPQPDTYYASALANQFAGRRLESATDVETSFNSRVSWYFGTDALPSAGEIDFVTTVIHEVLHGMGFLGTFSLDEDGNGSWGDEDGEVPPLKRGRIHRHDHPHLARNPQALARHLIVDHGRKGRSQSGSGVSRPSSKRAGDESNALPDVLDGLVVNGRGQHLLDTDRFPNHSRALGRQLTGGDLYWTGQAGTRANGGERIKLYAPSTWSPSSSVSHLDDDTYDGTPDALLTAAGETITGVDIGPLGRAILEDLGWTLRESPARR